MENPMIYKVSDQKSETRSDVRGGSGALGFLHLLDGTQTYGKTRLMARITLPAGTSIGEHPHAPDAESYIILSGEAEVTDNGVPVRLSAGDVMFTGNGDTHSIRNVGAQDLVLYATIFN